MIAAEPNFLYKPLLINEPFEGSPALPYYELAALLADLGAETIHGTMAAVDAEAPGGDPRRRHPPRL